MARRKIMIDFDESNDLKDALSECEKVLNGSKMKNLRELGVVFDRGFYRATITNLDDIKEKIAYVAEFQEPSYYVGCGNCEAEVVGKYCMECGCRLIYESEGE